jgi:hypothetical protein
MATQSPNACHFVSRARTHPNAWQETSVTKKERQITQHNRAMITAFLQDRVAQEGDGHDQFPSFSLPGDFPGDEYGRMLAEFMIWALYYR